MKVIVHISYDRFKGLKFGATANVTGCENVPAPLLSFTDPTNNWVTVALGQGNGAFAPHSDYVVPGRPGWIRAKDMSGDGIPGSHHGQRGQQHGFHSGQ